MSNEVTIVRGTHPNSGAIAGEVCVGEAAFRPASAYLYTEGSSIPEGGVWLTPAQVDDLIAALRPYGTGAIEEQEAGAEPEIVVNYSGNIDTGGSAMAEIRRHAIRRFREGGHVTGRPTPPTVIRVGEVTVTVEQGAGE